MKCGDMDMAPEYFKQMKELDFVDAGKRYLNTGKIFPFTEFFIEKICNDLQERAKISKDIGPIFLF